MELDASFLDWFPAWKEKCDSMVLHAMELSGINKPLEDIKIAIALSGGVDSMALLWLLKHAGYRNITALTVNHHLRSGSSDEADAIHDWCVSQSISHAILDWQPEDDEVLDVGDKDNGDNKKRYLHNIKTGIQEKARHARYGLLIDYCHGHDIAILFTAHHRDDQLEKAWMALEHGATVDNLVPMPWVRSYRSCWLLRPLLEQTKGELETLIQCVHWPNWLDPSNKSFCYTRNKIRHYLDHYQPLTSSVSRQIWQNRMWGMQCHMQEVKESLDWMVLELTKRYVKYHGMGAVKLVPALWKEVPYALLFRIVRFVLAQFNAPFTEIRDASLRRTVTWMTTSRSSMNQKFSFQKILMKKNSDDSVMLWRESAYVEADFVLDYTQKEQWNWDHRVCISYHKQKIDREHAEALMVQIGAFSHVQQRFPNHPWLEVLRMMFAPYHETLPVLYNDYGPLKGDWQNDHFFSDDGLWQLWFSLEQRLYMSSYFLKNESF